MYLPMRLFMETSIIYMMIALVITITTISGSIISVPPVDTVGCYGGLSTFYCESDRTDINVIKWTIDGNDLTDDIIKLRGISVNTNGGNSSLSIIGSEDNNGIHIGCTVATSGPPHIESQSALFTVTNIPPVMNLTINFTTNGVMMCTWSQPSCLPTNYSYSISVNNVSMINTTSTVYSMSNISSCTHYTVGVTVIDNSTQYQSLPVIGTAGVYTDLEFGLQSTRVSFNDMKYRLVDLKFKCWNLSDCNSLFFEERLSPPYVKISIIFVNDLLQSYDESTGIGYYTIGPFNESFIGYYSLHAQDKEIAMIKISTFHVQNASIIQLSNGTTMVECFFAYNSSADGCRFYIIPQPKGNITSLSNTKDGYEDTSTLYTVIDIPVGYYDVHVYDIIEKDIIAVEGDSVMEPAVNISYNHHISIVHLSSGMTYFPSQLVSVPPTTSSANKITTSSEVDSGSSPSLVILVVLSVGILVLAIVTVIVIVTGIVLVVRNRKNTQQEVKWYTQNPAYETVNVLHVRNNEAYEVVTMTTRNQ